ncbi:serine/threonine-protein kinase Chk1 [Centruroides vittatus]|uniref:serine/threonine-protein kinase Chk1 n=1 Tax=Centruroides vittatus TaxID=120091 RepID=UPI0035102404
MVKEFVEGWDIVQTLGEGAYGEVKLVVNRVTQDAVAVKILNTNRVPEASELIKKEICVHRMLSHENIIKFFGQRQEDNLQYIFLEYASGGELFDRIEPDIGMPQSHAHRYFCQLIAGVEYLHSKGITHRDLKPENLLLDENDNLKISDFGMATVFRYNGKERLLAKRCGTLPYVAPEVLMKEYKAEPADIWSCGVILVTLLAGELPWDKPTYNCKEYCAWKECKITESPWLKIDNLALSLLRKILMPIASKRYTLVQIKKHQWYKKLFKVEEFQNVYENQFLPCKRLCSKYNPLLREDTVMHLTCSQPELIKEEVKCSQDNSTADIVHVVSFSQPAHPEHMLLSTDSCFTNSQLQSTPNSSQSPLQRLVKRMTRFFVQDNAEITLKKLKEVFEKLGYMQKRTSSGQITIITNDKRKMQLSFKVNLLEMQDKILVDFRLSKGDGLEFKRHFIHIRNHLSDIIIKGPLTWPIAIATNSLP